MVNSLVKDWENVFEETVPKEIKDSYMRIKRAFEIMLTEAEPEVGLTPKEVIWTKNKTKLYRYISNQPTKHKTPFLMVYALINKPYILDITPGFSLVEYLVNRGFDVYLLDWGTPGEEDKHMKLDDYILDYIPKAVKKVLKTSGADEISMLGYCMGGTMTSVFASLHPELPIKNLVFMASPFDFENTGLYGRMLDERYFNVDKVVETYGNVPPEMIDFGNKMLKPMTNFYGPYVSLMDRSQNQRFVDSWKLMQKWLTDGIPFPGEAYRQWIREFYQQNKLIKGELVVRGRKVDLSKIKANVLNISAEKDLIAMPHQVEALMDAVSSEDKQYVCISTGHISITFGPKAVRETFPTIADWLEERSN
ncbi:class III poly(R)-hydroxyalkanoic acid synthase subunit PhaC [Schinkia azotoformans]|uniref:class III poly(R)-hydroxyalkanoic acid synthase subunit PhaC n=1 Tax=Schinkia azotoformans TaxID=1454 RepID=UPI002DBB4501|nr:class III poly(R)-hydroxyalkanoic acid synthase subunit PhaC [Schinkia azotoformans]MEC1740734.1 class III poly(R)-hydroxyalkanoic acid synthase subunit PhaC [Schinkia azotoformans]MEC1746434.1 class III poly(R)-hydroxyalkanoic acid synthase subunit PhaC [Schinkia azotoformans]MEC1758030.1 class III poly(R)-hydroxyalkanoic acid synthase subunit PhaC [Schinkia azotoformans]MEC1769369.1 class III poly(R)-hydroxyalkanoic acid synthase subunit PhaC [Schinkia azotoformans]MEC1789238.1 class III 